MTHAVTYFEGYGEEGDEDIGERQVCQVVVGDRPHPVAGDDGPYDQAVAGHGDHRYGSVEHGQDDHQQGRHLVQFRHLLVVRQRLVAVGGHVVRGRRVGLHRGHVGRDDGGGRVVGRRQVDRDRGRDSGYGRGGHVVDRRQVDRDRGRDSGGGGHRTRRRPSARRRDIGQPEGPRPAVGPGLCGVAVPSSCPVRCPRRIARRREYAGGNRKPTRNINKIF